MKLSGTADEQAELFMELVKPEGAEVLASYDHYAWKDYAAVTRNHYGKGTAEYVACKTSEGYLQKLLADAMKEAGIADAVQQTAFPVIVRRMKDENGKTVWFYFNYSHTPAKAVYVGADGEYLMKANQTFPGIDVAAGEKLALGSWDVQIIREK